MKAALIALTLLLLGSLGTSAYLLMEQKKAEKLISNAHEAAEEQKTKGLKLTEQNVALEKDLQLGRLKLFQLTNDLAAAQQTLASAQAGQGQMAQDLQSAQEAGATLQSQLAEAQGLANKAIVDFKATNAKLSKALIDANKTNTNTSVELDKAVQALKPFLATGLTPEQIKELQQKRPIEIAAPRFITPKPIKPGKLNKPILRTEQTP